MTIANPFVLKYIRNRTGHQFTVVIFFSFFVCVCCRINYYNDVFVPMHGVYRKYGARATLFSLFQTSHFSFYVPSADLPSNSTALFPMDRSPQDLNSCHPIGWGTQVYLPPPLRRYDLLTGTHFPLYVWLLLSLSLMWLFLIFQSMLLSLLYWCFFWSVSPPAV